MTETIHAVTIRAELRQIKTMADHTVNVVLNLPEDCIEQARVLMGWIGDEVGVVVADDADLLADGKQT